MNSTQGRIIIGTAAGALAFAIAANANAQAFYLQEQSVRGQGRAFSGEAADTGVDSLWWNPASIGGMQGGEASIRASAIIPRGKVVDQGTVIVRPSQVPSPVGGDPVTKNPIHKGVLPSGGVAYGFGKVAVGLALNAPYNFTTDYPADSWARYSADKTKLRTFDIQPSVAVMVTPQLSVGASLNIEYADATLSHYLPNLAANLPDGRQSLKGDGWDLGWSAGAQYRGGPVTVGLAYKSSVKHKLKGVLKNEGLLGPLAGQNGEINTSATFSTPWQAIGSIRVQANDKLTLNGQIVHFGWDKFDAIRLGAPINAAIPENYKKSWTYAVGADYELNPQWTVRAGVQHGETPTSSGNRDARVPDSNRWNFSAGASHAMSDRFTIDAAASYITFKDAPINRPTAAYAGSPAQTPILINGMLRDSSALVFSLGARAGF